jgi:hypothetical protein
MPGLTRMDPMSFEGQISLRNTVPALIRERNEGVGAGSSDTQVWEQCKGRKRRGLFPNLTEGEGIARL